MVSRGTRVCSHRSSGRGWRVLPALLVATFPGAGQAADAGPLPWQDAAPLAAPFLQLPFEAPDTIPEGTARAELRTIYSSSIASAHSHAADVEYRMETAQPTAALRWGVADGIELQLALPAATAHRGFLDDPIHAVESWFATENSRRGTVPPGVHFRLRRPGGPGASFAGPAQALGDPWLGVKVRLREAEGPWPALALRAAVKLPSAPFPFGSGVLEVAGGLLAAVDRGHTHAWLAVDLSVPAGPVTAGRFATRPHPAVQLALGREIGAGLTLLVQGSAHGAALRPVHVSEIDGWTFYVLAGARLEPAPRLRLGLGVAENLFVTERGTDIAAVLDLSYRW